MPITASSRAGFPRTGNSFLSTTLPDYNRVTRSTDIFANTMDARIKNSLETLAREAAANEEPMYVVGGTLRDALIDRDTHDLDLTCANARQWAEGFARSNRSRSRATARPSRLCTVATGTPSRRAISRGGRSSK